MGTGTLNSRVDNELIPANDHNQLVNALVGDFVGRNNSRAAEDLFGQLGTSVYRWLRAYVETYHIGDAANNLNISEPVAGEIKIARGTNEYINIKLNSIELVKSGGAWYTLVDQNGDEHKFMSKDWEELITKNDELREYVYQLICDHAGLFTEPRYILIRSLSNSKYDHRFSGRK